MDPVLQSIGFLNEVMTRHPLAISFAPGAPHLVHLDDVDLSRYVDMFLDHLQRSRGMSYRDVRRLLVEYGPAQGLINGLLARALARDMNIEVLPQSVVVTVGAQEAMLLVLRALMRDGDDLLGVVTPCFVGIRGAARLLDVDVMPLPETTDGPDLGAVRRACRAARESGRRLRAVYVAPDFSNPSGTRMSLEARRRLLTLAHEEDLFLLEDNAYGFTAMTDDDLPTLKALDAAHRVVYIGTFSKICFPGARVGFAVADQEVLRPDGSTGRLAESLAQAKSMVTVNTAPLCQALVGGMLLEHEASLARLGTAQAAHYQKNLKLLIEALDREMGGDDQLVPNVVWNRPRGGFFVTVELPVRVDETLLEKAAEEYGVLWAPMHEFYPDGGGRNKLRLSCSYLEPSQIREGIARFAQFVRDTVRLHDARP
jgi:(S)-3,5-dihydroxyphenylglycine transaminase